MRNGGLALADYPGDVVHIFRESARARRQLSPRRPGRFQPLAILCSGIRPTPQISVLSRTLMYERGRTEHPFEKSGAHSSASRLLGLATSRPADLMASASRTASFKPPA